MNLDLVFGKFPRQRKERGYVVYYDATNEHAIVQTHDAIGIIRNLATGEGRYTTDGGYFPHLALATPFRFPAEFVAGVNRLIEAGKVAPLTTTR